MNYKTIIYLLIIVCLSYIVLSNDNTYQRWDDIDIKVPCINNNTYCDDTTSCNITINYPNTSNYVKNAEMSNQDQYFNYTLMDTSEPGKYDAYVVCQSSTLNGYQSFSFTISSTGVEFENNRLPIVIALGIMIFGLILIGYVIDENHFALKFFMYSTAIVIIVVLVPSSLFVEKVPLTMFSIFPYLIYIVFAYVIVYIAYYMFKKLTTVDTQ